MPYRRRRNARRRKRRPRRRRRRKKMDTGNFIRVPLRKTGVQTLTGTSTAANSSFKLNEFSSYSKFTAIYEQFRIVKIIQKIYPMFSKGAPPVLGTIEGDGTMGDGTVVSITQLTDCLIGWKIDRDDITGFDNIADVIKNPKARVRDGFKSTRITFKPNTLTNLFGAVADNHSLVFDRWIETEDSSDVNYYGLCKLFHADGASGTYPVKYRLVTTAVVEFKNYRTDE